MENECKSWVVYVDASGKGRIMAFLKNPYFGTESMKYLDEVGTSNELEYKAVELGVSLIPNGEEAVVYSDSRLVVLQLSHMWSIKSDRLRDLAKRVYDMIEKKKLKVRFVWVPREKNIAGKFLG